ncbi:arsenate reductase (glutaredoxin) [Hydromonas duriensis]|uniref:Arsenate reductase n=1 Tax=Hydromonas duriensis TaxID=1527608 RepID=A0A4V3DJV4_9BURK|nr:arsenate reductase (glutaredoxin) [Hydromonas duriensis]TDR31630.1 arsenate reductase [Hydromonas duriensis]
MTSITIYHNPKCGTSRNTLALIRNAGVEPTIVHYLDTPPSESTLKGLLSNMNLNAREIMRRKEKLYDELNLADDKWTDEELIGLMRVHPILIERPIVVTPWGTKLCRPSEAVLDVLPLPQKAPFSKEDGTLLINEHGDIVSK